MPDWRSPDPDPPPSPAERTWRRRRSWAHSLALLSAMGALLGFCGWIVAGWNGILWSIAAGIIALTLAGRVPVDVYLRGVGARLLLPGQAPGLEASFAALCRRAGLSPVPRLCHLEEDLPLAFSLGQGEAAAVVVADSLLRHLSWPELRGILAHEIIHLRSGDITLKQIGMVLAWLTRIVNQIGLTLLFLGLVLRVFAIDDFPLLSLLVLVIAPIGVRLLQLAMSRTREAEADLQAAELTGDPAGLASALAKLRHWQERRLRRLFPTAHPFHLPTLLADHPPTEERIRRLMRLPQRAEVDETSLGAQR